MQKVIDGILTSYEILGNANQKLLILHGWKDSHKSWLPIANNLKDRYTVILLDLPGFGNTAPPPQDWGIYQYNLFVKQFLEAINISSAIVLGHSFGGRIAMLLASRFPLLVKKLILVDAAGMELKSFKTNLFSKVSMFFRWLPKKVKNIVGSRDYQQSGNLKNLFVQIINQPLREELKNIHCETLIVWGEKDKELPVQEALMLQNGINNSTLRVVWGTGHSPHITHPTDLLAILEEEGL